MRMFLQAVFPRTMNSREVSSLLEESTEELAADTPTTDSADGRRAGPGYYAAAYGKLRSRRVEGLLAQLQPDGREAALYRCTASDLAALESDVANAALKQLEDIRANGVGDRGPLVLELLRAEAAKDARRAMERIERHAIVLRVVPACIVAFVLLSLPMVLAASLESQLASNHPLGLRLLGISSDMAGFLTRALTPAFFGLLGALLGIAFTARAGGSGAHWRLERIHERGARLCLGALIGCLVSVTGPVLLGSGDDYTRLLLLSMVFGASQDTFYSRVLSRAKN